MTPTLTELAQAWVEAALEADRVHSLDLSATDKRNREAECKAAFLTAAAQAEKEAKELREEVERLRKIEAAIKDPAAVRANLLRGAIAKPADLIFMHDELGPYAALTAELSALRAEVAEVLRPFAEAADRCSERTPDFMNMHGMHEVVKHITVGDLRSAAALLAKLDGGKE